MTSASIPRQDVCPRCRQPVEAEEIVKSLGGATAFETQADCPECGVSLWVAIAYDPISNDMWVEAARLEPTAADDLYMAWRYGGAAQ